MTNVIIRTSMGDIELELYEDKAPETVKNFLSYVDDCHYDNTIFHRVIDNFMIQGGGFDATFTQLPTKAPIKNEADNGLKNDKGTIAMARTSDINSATCQFFLNVKDNDFLNFSSPDERGYGYCVFGKVSSGMDVIEQIKEVPTGQKGPHGDVPIENIMIKEIVRK
jgi:peptidyl-prolyl cis-trans isomerase B (cyclophilin B)